MKHFLIFLLTVLFLTFTFTSCEQSKTGKAPEAIRIYNPYYCEYNGNPVLLVAGLKEDNLFNHPEELAAHLDVLKDCGENYIRNTISSRNLGASM